MTKTDETKMGAQDNKTLNNSENQDDLDKKRPSLKFTGSPQDDLKKVDDTRSNKEVLKKKSAKFNILPSYNKINAKQKLQNAKIKKIKLILIFCV